MPTSKAEKKKPEKPDKNQKITNSKLKWEDPDQLLRKMKDPNFNEKDKEAQLERARDLYNVAITEVQNTPTPEKRQSELFFKRANVFMRLGQYQNAITDLWAAIRHDTGNAQYYSSLARCNQELGQITDALSNYAEAIRNSGKDQGEIATIYLERGLLYSKQGKYVDAIQDFETAITNAISKKQDCLLCLSTPLAARPK